MLKPLRVLENLFWPAKMRSALRIAASPMGHERGIVLGCDPANPVRSRVNSGVARGAVRRRVWPVRRLQHAGNRVVFGRRVTTLVGHWRGRDQRRAVAKTGKKRPRNGRRREVVLSASHVNCWLRQSAPDRQAPRTGHSSKCLLRYARSFIQIILCGYWLYDTLASSDEAWFTAG